jgi:hypothetical protein
LSNREELKKYYWEIYHRINENNKVERQCTQCKEWLEENYDNFYMKNKMKLELGFSAECKKCASMRTINNLLSKPNIKEFWHEQYVAFKKENEHVYEKYRETHKEERDKYTKEYQKDPKNKDKFKIYAKNHRHHDITKTEEKALLKIFNYQCAYCGMTLEEHKKKFKQKLHNDHVDDKGANDLRNDVPACKSCNSRKHERDMEWWYRRQKFFSEERFNKIIWWIIEGYKEFIEDKPPYRILKERNEDNNKFHWNLWSVDEMRNILKIIATKDKKKELNEDIKRYLTQ